MSSGRSGYTEIFDDSEELGLARVGSGLYGAEEKKSFLLQALDFCTPETNSRKPVAFKSVDLFLRLSILLCTVVTYWETNYTENKDPFKATNAALINGVLNWCFINCLNTMMEIFSCKLTEREQFLADAGDPLKIKKECDFRLYKPIAVGSSFLGAFCSAMLAFNAGNKAAQHYIGFRHLLVALCNYGNTGVNTLLYSKDLLDELMAFRYIKNDTQIAWVWIEQALLKADLTEHPEARREANEIFMALKACAAGVPSEQAAVMRGIHSNAKDRYPTLFKKVKRESLAVFSQHPDRSWGRAVLDGSRYLAANLSWLVALGCTIDSAPGVREGIESFKVDFKGNEWLALLLYGPEATFLWRFFVQGTFYIFDRMEAQVRRLSCKEGVSGALSLFLGLGVAGVSAGYSVSSFQAMVADGDLLETSLYNPASSFINLDPELAGMFLGIMVVASSFTTNFKAIAEWLVKLASWVLCQPPSEQVQYLQKAYVEIKKGNFVFFAKEMGAELRAFDSTPLLGGVQDDTTHPPSEFA